MDIYIIRKCRVEQKNIKNEKGDSINVPTMTKEDLYTYIIKGSLTPEEREKIQQDLEEFHLKYE